MGKTRIERILRAVESEVWAIQPEKLSQIAEVLCARAESGQIPTVAEVEAAEARQRGSARVVGSVAVIPLEGTLMKRASTLDVMSGASSIETFSDQFRRAVVDSEIGSIAIRVHSPGGSVYGIEEAFRAVHAARGSKRVVSIFDSLAASAAYYVAVGAGEVVVSPSGEGGAIGCYTVHFDYSEALAKAGIKAKIIKYGDHKAEGHPYEPLADDAEDHMLSIVTAYGRLFDRAVARGRGVPIAKVREQFGQGRTFDAERLVRFGMADRIATLDETLEDLARGRGKPGSRASAVVPADLEPAAEATESIAATASSSPSPFAQLDTLVEGALGLLRGAAAAVPDSGDGPRAKDPPPSADSSQESPKTDEPTADGGAAPDSTDAPTEPASTAREESMSDQDTAAQTQGAGTQDPNAVRQAAMQAERERARQIRAIGQAHSIDAADVEKWLDDGLSIDAVNAAVLTKLRGRQQATPNVQVGTDREAEKPFPTLGHQLQAVALAARSPESTDKRLKRLNEEFAREAAATGASTAVPSDGGFVVQTDFVPGVTTKMWEEGRVLSRTNRVTIGENSNRLSRRHIKEHSRKTGSRYGGVRVYRTAEAKTVEGSHQEVREQNIELEKLMGIYYATEEIMQDAVALTTEAERGFRRELTFVAENEVFRGTGAGQMLGFLVSNALVTVAAEGGQTADTVNVTNVAKMMSRLPPRSFPTASWYIHSTVIPQLVTLTIGDTPVFIPGGSIAGARFGTLFGMPIEPVEYCAPLGDVGDIALVDLNEFTTIDKGAERWQNSIHVRFLQDETAFKLTTRLNGQPDWDEAVEEFQGAGKLSPFIVLAAR